MAGAFLLSSRKEKRLAKATKRRKTLPQPTRLIARSQYEARQRRGGIKTVRPPFMYVVHGSVDGANVEMYNGYVEIFQLAVNDEAPNAPWNDPVPVMHLLSVTVHISDEIATMTVDTVVAALEALITQTDILRTMLPEPTDVLHSVMLEPEMQDPYLVNLYYDAHVEFTYERYDARAMHTPYWWVRRCRKCYRKHRSDQPHAGEGNMDDAFDDMQLITSQLVEMRLTDAGDFIVESIHPYQ